MNVFCTLFDSNYLTRGMAMYHSLTATGEDFQLYIFAFDELAETLLKKMALPNVTVISLQEFESEELLNLKKTRSRAEYCWTCTSFSILYVLEHYQAAEVTYLDADLYFFAKPSILLDEFHASQGDVLITEHRYSPQCRHHADVSGKYCVQFMTFKNNDNGLKVLKWWRDRCAECCTAIPKDGMFGDQKYLDDWTERFTGIHVLKNLGGGVAPWNVLQYAAGHGPTVNGKQVVFYHYHGLKIFSDDTYKLASYYLLPQNVIELFYLPYIKALEKAMDYVKKTVDASFNRGKLPTKDEKLADGNIMKALADYGIEKLKQTPQILVYGAGSIAREVIYALSTAGIDSFSVVISESQADSYFMGNRIRSLKEFSEASRETVVIIAVGENLQQELQKNARQLGFNEIISLI